MKCPYAQNQTTGQVMSEPPGPNDAGIERSLGCFAQYIDSLGLGGNMETISFGGRPVAGFGALGDGYGLSGSDIFGALNDSQKTWLISVMQSLEGARRDAGTAACPQWPQTFQTSADFQAAVACTQAWLNAGGNSIRTDGVLDEQTLCAIIVEGYKMPIYAQNKFPDPSGTYCKGMQTTTTEKKSNTVYYVAGGIAAATIIGGIVLSRRKRAA